MTPGELLDLSDERDTWMRHLLAAALAAYERGYAEGDHDGYERGARVLEESWPAIVKPVLLDRPASAELAERRWGPGGRDHFGDPRPDDRTPAKMIADAYASWEPFGLPEPGMVYLAGPVVHWHRPCTAACYANPPGWYTIAEVIAILRTLPGDYADNIAELKRKAASLDQRRAA